MKNSLLTSLILLLSTALCSASQASNHPHSHAQINEDSIVFYIDTVTADKGEIVCLQLSTDHFEDIILFEMSIIFDPAVLRFVNASDIPDIIPGFSDANFSTPLTNSSDDTFIISWLENNLNGHTLPDNTEFFEMCFEVIGENGEKSPLNIDRVEVANSNLESIHIELKNGLVCVGQNVSTSENPLGKAYTFYPNPSSERIFFNQAVQQVTIWDAQGRKALELTGEPRKMVNIGHLPMGNYWLQTEGHSLPLRVE